MKSLTTLLNNLAGITKNSSNTSQFTDWINQTQGIVNTKKDWKHLTTPRTISTVASQEAYDLPENLRTVQDVYVTVGTTVYMPQPIATIEDYKRLLSSQLGTSDITQFYFVDDQTLRLIPAPASSSNTITIRYRRKNKDLSASDYTTGTVTMTNNSTTVTGAGTTFTASMVGRWIRATAGDYEWYKIESFTSTTVVVLDRVYNGATVAGSAFVIGEMPLLPEQYHDLCEFRPLYLYYMQNQNPTLAAIWKAEYKDLLDVMIDEQGRLVEANATSNIPLWPDTDIWNQKNYRDPSIP